MDFSTTTGIVLLVYILAELFKLAFLRTDRKRQYLPVVCAVIGMFLGLGFWWLQTVMGVNVFGTETSLMDAIGSGISSGLAATGVNQVIKKRFGTVDPETGKTSMKFSTAGVSDSLSDINGFADKDSLISEASEQPPIEEDIAHDEEMKEANQEAIPTDETETTTSDDESEAGTDEAISDDTPPAEATQEAKESDAT